MIALMLAVAGLAGYKTEAQDIFYSKEQKFTFQNGDFSVVGWCGDRLYTYRDSKEGFYLDAYNDSMRLLATVALDFFPQKIYETRFFVSGDRIIVLYQAVQEGMVVQYAALLDDRARMLQKPVALDSVKMAWLSSDRQYYSSAISNDKNRIMVFGMSSRKSRQLQFNTILLDNNLNVLAKGTPFIESDDDFTMGQALLGNDGSLYLSAFTGENARKYSGDAWIFRLSPDGQRFVYKPLPLGSSYLSGLYLRMDDVHNQVYLSAFYAAKKSGNLDGVLYSIYSPQTDSFPVFKLIPFDEELRNATDDRNKKKAFNDYEVRNVIVKNDGGFILVAENFYVTSRSNMYGGGFRYYSWYNNYPGTYTSEYHYGNIMVVDYDAEGNRKWHGFIRKEQYSQEDGGLFSSYLMLNSGASLVFLYNDFNSSKSSLRLAALDVNGEMQLKRMSPGRTAGGDWVPRSGKQTDLRELLIPVLRKNNLCFARVVF